MQLLTSIFGTIIKLYPFSFLLQTTDAVKNIRLEIKLQETNEKFYNEIHYFDSINPTTQQSSSALKENLVGATIRDFDEYIEDTFIDDSDLFQDTIPFGMETEHEGFYINKGPLKLKRCVRDNTEGNETETNSVEKLISFKNERVVYRKMPDKLRNNKRNRLKENRRKLKKSMIRQDHVYAKLILNNVEHK